MTPPPALCSCCNKRPIPEGRVLMCDWRFALPKRGVEMTDGRPRKGVSSRGRDRDDWHDETWVEPFNEEQMR